jgi:hypothetical protein
LRVRTLAPRLGSAEGEPEQAAEARVGEIDQAPQGRRGERGLGRHADAAVEQDEHRLGEAQAVKRERQEGQERYQRRQEGNLEQGRSAPTASSTRYWARITVP